MCVEIKDYDDFVKKYGPILSDSPAQIALTTVGNFFNEVGILLHRRLMDIGLATDLFTYGAAMIWEKMKPLVEGIRKELNQPEAAKWFEYLYNEMKKREQTLQLA